MPQDIGRYSTVPAATWTSPEGKQVRYRRVRWIPKTQAYVQHRVGQGERLDLISYQYYQDAERFWRICDANQALWPPDLVAKPERVILIPPAEE